MPGIPEHLLSYASKEDLLEEIQELRQAYEGACQLAMDLYLAGTEQTIENFSGIAANGPIEEVRHHLESVRKGIAKASLRCTRNDH